MTRRRLERVASRGTQRVADPKPTLEAVLDHYAVDYKPWRQSQMIPCLLHEDITPSCSIDLDKQLWNCHSCGEGGDSWELIKMREETDFDGARAFAASECLATGGAGGSGDELPAGRYGRRTAVSRRKGSDARQRGYTPSWRRR